MHYKRIIIVITCLLFLFGSGVFPQDTAKVDSLLKRITASVDDTNKVRMLLSLSRQYIGNDEKVVYTYLNKALSLSKKLSYDAGTARAWSQIGSHYFRTGCYIESISASARAANIYYRTGDESGVAWVCSNMGNVYFELGEYSRALECQFYSLKIQNKLKTAWAMAATMNAIGNIYTIQGRYSEARHYFETSLGIMDSLKSELGIARSYNYLGELCLAEADTVAALEYFLKSEKIYENKLNKSGLAKTLNNLGKISLAKKSYAEAAEYYRKSVALAGDAEAREVLEDAYSGLASAYEKMKKFEEALYYCKLYYMSEDSVFDVSRQKLMDMQYQMESEKNESRVSVKNMQLEKNRIEIQKQNFQVFAMSLGGLLLLALLIISYISYKRKKKDNKVISLEKKRSEELLLNILPQEIAEELKQNGKSAAKKIDMVTVLFADFVGFSKYAEMLEPEEVVKDLDQYFRAFDEILNKYDVEKIKTIGDAYMCAGGVPGVNTSNPWDVVNCGLEMRDHVMRNKQQKIAENKMYLEIRIGIHTGPVVAGIVGVKKFSYDIWGDTVNVASRVQSAGVPDKVNISGATYQCVKDQFRCESRGKVPVKNLGEIEMYFVEPR